MSCDQAEPYLACAIMQRAEHSLWPPTQLKYFNQGKDMLEAYITNYPDDMEARYVRLLVQQGCPSFLGYTNQIQEDVRFIIRNLESVPLPSRLQEKMKIATEENCN